MVYNSRYNLGVHNNISCGLMHYLIVSFVNLAVKYASLKKHYLFFPEYMKNTHNIKTKPEQQTPDCLCFF